jgi:hypothetical protein
MRQLIFVFFCFLLLFSCSNEKYSKSENNIHRDSVLTIELLTDYMTEIFLIEAAIYKAQHDGKDVKDYAVMYYMDFFEKHSLTRQRLKMSVEFFIAEHKMEGILQNVVENLTEIDLHTPSVQPNDDEKKDKPVSKPPWLENIPIE